MSAVADSWISASVGFFGLLCLVCTQRFLQQPCFNQISRNFSDRMATLFRMAMRTSCFKSKSFFLFSGCPRKGWVDTWAE